MKGIIEKKVDGFKKPPFYFLDNFLILGPFCPKHILSFIWFCSFFEKQFFKLIFCIGKGGENFVVFFCLYQI